MLYCPKCKKAFEADDETCPTCGWKLPPVQETDPEAEAAETLVATMTAIGLF